MIRKFLLSFGVVFSAALMLLCVNAFADEIEYTCESSDGYDTSFMYDDDYYTKDYYQSGDTLTFTADEDITGVYIKWDTEPGEWTLTVDGKESTHGQNDYLHEYVKLDTPAKEFTVTIGTDDTYITDVYLFSEGELPEWVEVWQEPWDKADILFFSTHSDDEVLFFGGLIPTYIDKGYRVQVAYFCNFSEAEPYRRHEQLAGIWHMGVDHYPQLGKFDDIPLVYNTTEVTDAMKEESFASFDQEEGLSYVVETLRRFRPQVLVGQDCVNGEYGHGAHIVCSQLVADASEAAGDSSQFAESVSEYGVWDVKKTYIHLYPENQITVDARVPLDKFGGKTAFEIAEEAYLKHESQQWMWFYVTDGDPAENKGLNCTIFGLYRSTVGADTGNDIMENITSYDQQEEEARKATETTVTEATEENAENVTAAEPETTETKKASGSFFKTILIILGVILGLLIIFMIIIAIISAQKKKKREEERRRRRQQQLRNAQVARRSQGQSQAQPRTRTQTTARKNSNKE